MTYDPGSPSVAPATTESGVSSEAPTSPPDVNPDVVAQSPQGTVSDPAAEPVAPVEPPSLEERVKAIEVRLFGWHHGS